MDELADGELKDRIEAELHGLRYDEPATIYLNYWERREFEEIMARLVGYEIEDV